MATGMIHDETAHLCSFELAAPILRVLQRPVG